MPRLRASRHEYSRAVFALAISATSAFRLIPNPMDFSASAEVFLDGRWYTIGARHNPRIRRIVMGRGRDAAHVPISTAFGIAKLARFEVITQEQTQDG
jgi:hypothetical protein